MPIIFLRCQRIGVSGLIGASVLALVLAGGLAGGCSRTSTSNQQEQTAMSSPSLEEVLDAHKDSLMAVRGVVGVGQALCDDTPCIRIYASRQTPEIDEQVPDSIQGYAVDVEVTGPIGPRQPD